MRTFSLPIQGMTCNGCVAAASKALESVPGVLRVEVRLSQHDALITADEQVKDDDLDAALVRAGFSRGPETTQA
jgi:Cu+-exporting ATPase